MRRVYGCKSGEVDYDLARLKLAVADFLDAGGGVDLAGASNWIDDPDEGNTKVEVLIYLDPEFDGGILHG